MQKLPSLTGARFLAAFSVVIFHFGDRLALPSWLLRLFDGPAAVAFFFVLSGFILTYNYEAWFRSSVSAASYLRFCQLRFARIYPVHVLTLAVMTPISLLMLAQAPQEFSKFVHGDFEGYQLLTSWLANAALVMVYFPFPLFNLPWNTPAWSIGCEVFFYAAFPLIVNFIGRVSSRRGLAVVTLCIYIAQIAVLGLAVYSLIVLYGRGNVPWYGFNMAVYAMPPVRVFEFSVGCCAGMYMLRYGRDLSRVRHIDIGLIIVLAIIAALLLAPAVQGRFAGWAMVFRYCAVYTLPFAVLIILLAAGRGAISNFLSTRPLQIAGEASFSLYMLHWAALMIWNYWLNWGPVGTWILVISLVPVSICVFFCFEDPARRWISAFKSSQSGLKATVLSTR